MTKVAPPPAEYVVGAANLCAACTDRCTRQTGARVSPEQVQGDGTTPCDGWPAGFHD